MADADSRASRAEGGRRILSPGSCLLRGLGVAVNCADQRIWGGGEGSVMLWFVGVRKSRVWVKEGVRRGL